MKSLIPIIAVAFMLVYFEWGRGGYTVIIQGLTEGECISERGYAYSTHRNGTLECLPEAGDS